MTEERKKEIKECLIKKASDFPIRQTLCDFCGVSYDTFTRWMTDGSGYYDQEFADRFTSEESAGVIKLGKRASPEFLLATSKPEIFGKRNETNVNMQFVVVKGEDNGNQTSQDQCVRTDEATPETTGSTKSSGTV